MSKSILSIRRKKRAKHPQVIVETDKTKFGSMTLTHKKKSGHSNNLPLKKNPNPTDAQKAYLRKQIVKDFKYNFSKAFKNMKISDEDAEIILNYLDKKKK